MRRLTSSLRRHAAEYLAFVALLALTACGSGGGGTPPAPGGPPAPELNVEFMAGPTPYGAEATVHVEDTDAVENLAFRVRSKPGAMAPDVSVSFARTYLIRTGAIDAGEGTITVPVFGLYADHINEITFKVALTGDAPLLRDFEFATAPLDLPVDREVPQLVVDQADAALDLGFILCQGRAGPSIIDVDGELRWLPEEAGASVWPRVRVADGILGGFDDSNDIHHLDWLGRASIFQMSDARCVSSHHNLEPGKTGYLNNVAFDDGNGFKGASVLAEMTAAGVITKIWDFDQIFRDHILANLEDADAFVPFEVNWFHMNSAIYDPSDDSIIASSRHNFVVKVDYDTGAIKWLLGDTSRCWYLDYPASFQPLALDVTGDAPIGQHALSMSTDGQFLMLMNNGKGGPNRPTDMRPCRDVERDYSKVSIYEIDAVTGTADEVWSLDLGEAVYSPVCSSVYRTQGDNLLVVFSSVEGGDPRIIVANDAKEILFDATAPGSACQLTYAAEEIHLQSLRLD